MFVTLFLCFQSCSILSLWILPGVSALAVPKSEALNRRKSPALWREDLQKEQSPLVDRGLVMRPPEVMAPVGGWPQLHAALANGADSIYLGLSAFSARARASNFDPSTELPQAVQLCHEARVKVYVALNTLVFDQELEEVEDLIRKCAQADVDALIVQDLGIARLAQTVAPQLQIHASTQQTITSADGAAFCEELFGTTRVVMGRELSVQEIDVVAKHLDPHVEIEAFCHGALCVSYSGQCFSSEAWGGRSANRGQCAQACRLPYGLIDNGELKELGDFAYLLSPQDLCGIDQVPQLLEAHVSCLKIEGRLKDAAYVAATTRAYRNAVDQAWKDYCEKHAITKPMTTRILPTNEQVTRKELAQVFSRGQDQTYDGLSQGFFQGSQHQVLVRGRSPRHRGVHVGRVVPEGANWKEGLIITTDTPGELKLGDGIVVDRGMAQEEELGGSIFEIYSLDDQRVAIRFSRDTERNWKKYDEHARKSGTTTLAPPGAHVWKTSDATLDKKLKRLSEAPPPKSMSVQVSVTGALDQPLQIRIDNGQGLVGVGVSPGNLQVAERQGLSSQSIQKAIGTLGNTKWNLQGYIDLSDLAEGVWCPLSWIKDARREAVEDLELQLSQASSKSSNEENTILQHGVTSQLLSTLQQTSPKESSNEVPQTTTTTTTKLSVLARNYEQVDALCQMVDEEGDGPTIDEIIVDFLEVDGMREAVARIRQTRVPIVAVVASPRIIKPEESGIWRTLLRLRPDALLVRSTGLLYRMMKLGGPGASVTIDSQNGMTEDDLVTIPELIGDFSLNVANAITAWELLEYGCSRVTASYDLSANAIAELVDTVGPKYSSKIEVVAHAHLPIFHTEHCVFARFLSNGNSYIDCGHACTRHNVHLRDQTGADNLVLADMGCRNTVFSAQAQSGAYSLMQWIDTGARHFRIELVDESEMRSKEELEN